MTRQSYDLDKWVEGYKQCKAEKGMLGLEAELNNLWVERCKANDKFLEFSQSLQDKGYTFEFSNDTAKQIILKKAKNDIQAKG